MTFSFTEKKIIKFFSIITLCLTFVFMFIGMKFYEIWVYVGLLCSGLSMLSLAFIYDETINEFMLSFSLLPWKVSRAIIFVTGIGIIIFALELLVTVMKQ